MNVPASKNGLSVLAYKGDAMTLLAFDLDKSKTKDFTGFSIEVAPPGRPSYFLFNRITYDPATLKKNGLKPGSYECNTTEFSPLQTFRWVHTPSTNHNINDWIFGNYTYKITPRYLKEGILLPLNRDLTAELTIEVSPYKKDDLQIGFTRGFIESQAYTRHFGSNNKTRPDKKELIFKISQNSGPLDKDKKKNPHLHDYTFETQHKWLGWQARQRIIELLDETVKDKNLSLDIFAFDLNEPVICESILQLAGEGRARVILDDSDDHTKSSCLESVFDSDYRKGARDKTTIVRGHFSSLAHSKVFIQKRDNVAVKVLTGSTNFSTNGLYINANHVIIFNNEEVAALYEDAFNKSFGEALMKEFKKTDVASKDNDFKTADLPEMTIRFSPHNKEYAGTFFTAISDKIKNAHSDVLFAIMKDNSASSILDAIRLQVKSDKIFTYGITDVIGDKADIFLYKPDSKKGVRIAGKPGQYILPPPFEPECSIPAISVHHKFVVVDFKGEKPVVYCGSSNLAFKPEQNNGDNLIEIRDRDAVTVFAIEAIRLVDHFHFRNRESLSNKKNSGKSSNTVYLHGEDEKDWVDRYYNKNDLKCLERTLLIKTD
jgi:phosphatidylserine/phosphatidylglycerophosphate/cardiolipin synthase-like enzyme